MIKYAFTADGVNAFLESVWGDIVHALDRDDLDDLDIFITIGNREIKIPITADNIETVENAITDCLQNGEVIA